MDESTCSFLDASSSGFAPILSTSSSAASMRAFKSECLYTSAKLSAIPSLSARVKTSMSHSMSLLPGDFFSTPGRASRAYSTSPGPFGPKYTCFPLHKIMAASKSEKA